MRVLIFGTFDQLHPGHEFFLREAQKRGELWVSVGLDKNVEHIKGVKPVQSEEKRKRVIEEAFPGVHVRLGDEEDYLEPVREVKPDLILLGYDQKLPPGVAMEDLPCPVERIEAFQPDQFKSSLNR